ncbi:aspartic proteinase CDR1-like [Abrus precatorius]|uniref:Aspartic proteinase CDR1-like n=1 Tax=Abrus precatorius TaxID=3816 RepID=A0A8B8MA29_ABRPR|nr:aspartic proteinase CDR1-like [Abrus precatorius]
MVVTNKSQPLYHTLNLLCIFLLLLFFHSESIYIGYTTHLISYDSPLSPFHNPSNTHFDRLRNAFRRSLNRVNHFKVATLVPSKGTTQDPINSGGGEYLMKISLGTPPIEVIGIADTGSDLTWTQCLPCIKCYNQAIPLFDPGHSSSYLTIPCTSKICNALDTSNCNRNISTCGYSYSYGDGSRTAGNLAAETLTLGTSSSNPISLKNIVFGCGHNTTGIFDASGSGIVGLGGGELSLVSQLGTQFGTKKFSYCLIPTSSNSTSKISFGNDAVVSGPSVVITPIVTKVATFYYLTLEAFTIGNQRIPFVIKDGTETRSSVEGNIIIDSGTTLTILPLNVYNDMVSALDKVITAKKVSDPNGLLTLCYQNNRNNIKLPIITAHFKGGDVNLQPVNMFSWVKEDVVCFTVIAFSNFSILGNLAQANFLIGYDLEAGTVSFKATDCTRQ